MSDDASLGPQTFAIACGIAVAWMEGNEKVLSTIRETNEAHPEAAKRLTENIREAGAAAHFLTHQLRAQGN